jgi:hypothetical protein
MCLCVHSLCTTVGSCGHHEAANWTPVVQILHKNTGVPQKSSTQTGQMSFAHHWGSYSKAGWRRGFRIAKLWLAPLQKGRSLHISVKMGRCFSPYVRHLPLLWPPECQQDFPVCTPGPGLLQIAQQCIPDFGRQGISLDFPLFRAAHADFLFRPVNILKTQATHLANAKAVDRAKQDRAAAPDLNRRRAVDTGEKLLHLFPRRALR